MTGRGRSMTLPAWMNQQQNEASKQSNADTVETGNDASHPGTQQKDIDTSKKYRDQFKDASAVSV